MENAITPYRFFISIDLSKTYFDASIVGVDGKKLAHKRLDNTPQAFPALLDWVASTTRCEAALLFCMEHTGGYGRRLCHFLQGCNEQVKGYYKRKKNEGKPGLLVLNNIKNKIVHQILAVVRSQVPYDPAFVHPREAA